MEQSPINTLELPPCPIHDTPTEDCAFCEGKKSFYQNNLATTHPRLLDYWHPFLNEDLTPYELTAASTRSVWWLCPTCYAAWKAPVAGMANGWGCIYDCHQFDKIEKDSH